MPGSFLTPSVSDKTDQGLFISNWGETFRNSNAFYHPRHKVDYHFICQQFYSEKTWKEIYVYSHFQMQKHLLHWSSSLTHWLTDTPNLEFSHFSCLFFSIVIIWVQDQAKYKIISAKLYNLQIMHFVLMCKMQIIYDFCMSFALCTVEHIVVRLF